MVQVVPRYSPKLGIRLVEVASTGQAAAANEAIFQLDTLTQCLVKDKDLATPPTLVDGEAYIVAASPTGAWSGKAGYIAAAINGGWVFFQPKKGWLVTAEDEGVKYEYNGTSWVAFSLGASTAPTVTVVSKTSNFTVSLAEAAIYLVDASSGNVTVTMLAAASMTSRGFFIKRIDSSANSVTIDGNGSETIDGQLTINLSQWDSVFLVSNGTALFIV